MTLIQTFHGNATNGTELTAVYAEQPAANVAFALVFPAMICRDLCTGAVRSQPRQP